MDDVEGGFYIKAGQLPEEKVFQLMTCLRNAAEVIDKEAEVLRESRR